MSNLRIIYDNAADRATVSASTMAGNLKVGNLLRNKKSNVWRATTDTATLTVVWPTPQDISAVFLAFTNLTQRATIRVRGYLNGAQTYPIFDTGVKSACPGEATRNWKAEGLAGANSFAFGGGSYGRVWFGETVAVRKLVIDIKDPTNPAGYIEAARLICGKHWSPKYNAAYGAQVSSVDESTNFRTQAGDLLSDSGVIYRTQSITLAAMDPVDRSAFWRLMRYCGKTKPFLLSLYPEDKDVNLEQAHEIYCKIADEAPIATQFNEQYTASLKLQEV